MKLRFPLSAKILLWFFLNLILLAALFYGFLRVQFRVGLDSLLAGHAGARIEALGTVLAAELRDTPRADWTAVLNRFRDAYGVRLFLVRPDGGVIAGEAVTLPDAVARRLDEFGPAGPLRPPGEVRPRADSPRRPDWREELSDARRPRPPEGAARRSHPKFMVRTTGPVHYWVGLRLPLGDPAAPPQFLLIQSSSLGGGGLFLDVKPWLLVGFGAIGLSVLFWIPLMRGITRSISQMTRATERVAEGRFDIRVDESRGDELGRLGQAINRMALRLDGFVAGQKRFLGDAAHELCSPLARMQMALGILEQKAASGRPEELADLRDEVEYMSSLVNELLSFSKAGLLNRELRLQTVSLAELVRRVVAREAGEGGAVQMEVPEALCARAEPDLLARALANLVRNALRYAGSAGPIMVRGEDRGDAVVLTVSDSGPGVPPEALQCIFDPFYRLESSRSRETGGIGLGLAIVKTCVEACRGTVTAANRPPSGLHVELRLLPGR